MKAEKKLASPILVIGISYGKYPGFAEVREFLNFEICTLDICCKSGFLSESEFSFLK